MKIGLRSEILGKRNQLSKDDILQRSEKIKETVFNLEQFKKSKIIMFFVSFNNEIGTHDMIKAAFASKTVIIPKVEHNKIEPSVILDFDNLVPTGKWEILEPIELMKIAYKNIDLVFVPGIAFDKNGYRLGYGFGYYDKFLKKVPKAVKIGLCFDFQVVDKIPREMHDVPVNFIVTEERVIECRK